MANNRVTFGSKLGVVLATVGCAVGLGSVWRFPYMLGANGGAAFLLVYILFMIFLGIPVMVTEFFIGRYGGFFQEDGSRNKMVLDRVQRDLGRIFDIKLLLGCLRLDA